MAMGVTRNSWHLKHTIEYDVFKPQLAHTVVRPYQTYMQGRKPLNTRITRTLLRSLYTRLYVTF